MKNLFDEAIFLLQKLVATPSISRKEAETAKLIQQFFGAKNIPTKRHLNNVWAVNKHFDPGLPTLLLNSHHDTVKPNSGYTNDPFQPKIEFSKLSGLGSNDAGGALVSLITAFTHFYDQKNLNYNLVLAATAEEEISGENGITSIMDKLPAINCAIVGEPTQMRMAVAEKGLMVLDCIANGKSGHAAQNDSHNAIYTALKDIDWIKGHQFEKTSEFLGPVKMTTTVIKSGTKHNVVPNHCSFTVDIRTTDTCNNEEVLSVIREHLKSKVTPRSTRLKPSAISLDHPLVTTGQQLDIPTYGSPTLSDQALLPMPSIKMGPGKSARSHTADEFIYLDEIKNGITTYINFLNKLL
jgi:acetylornithine deacetylase